MTILFWLIAGLVLVAIFGWAITGFVWFVLWYALVGLVVGGLGRLLVRGTSSYGVGMTILAGIGGALLGGLLAHALGTGGFVEFLLAVLVAAVLVAVTGPASRRSV
jgi:uncharacterized membrane protein YeaQ/YmgE (transglycosylase-associated protein family)